MQEDLPKWKKVYCEICGQCNLRCSFCPITDQPREIMDVAFFRQILSQLVGVNSILHLHVLGEPLLHPQWQDILDSAWKFGQKISLVTNGTLLVCDDSFFHPSLKEISISLQSFEGNHDGNLEQYHVYLQQILSWVNWFRQHNQSTRINLRLWNQTNGEQAKWLQQMAVQIIATFFDKNLSAVEMKATTFPQAIKLLDYTFLVLAPLFQWPNLLAPFYREDGECLGLREQIGILSDGTVVPCCLDHAGCVNLGNLHQQTLVEIFNSKRTQEMRQGFDEGHLVEELCRHCEFATRFKTHRKRRK